MSKELIQTQMNVNNRQVRVMRVDNIDYISLTDLAKYQNSSDKYLVFLDQNKHTIAHIIF